MTSNILYQQQTIEISGNSQEQIQVSGGNFKNLIVLNATHTNYDFLINGDKVGNIEPRINVPTGVDIENYRIINKSNDTLKIKVAIGVDGIADYRSALSGTTIKASDTITHGLLDLITTANQSTATAVQGLNSKLDGQYMAGLTPLGQNNFSQHFYSSGSCSVISQEQNVRGFIIRLLEITMGSHDDGVKVSFSNGTVIGGDQYYNGTYNGSRIILKQICVPPGVGMQISNKDNAAYVNVSYDIL